MVSDQIIVLLENL